MGESVRMSSVWRRWARREAGFSLMGTMVAMSLMGILSVTALPVVSSLHSRYALTTAANQLGFEIARARMQASAQARFIRIRFYTTQSYARERSDDGVNFTRDDAIVTLPLGIIGTATGGGGPTFAPSGLASSLSDIILSDGTAVNRVRTNVLGRVTLLTE